MVAPRSFAPDDPRHGSLNLYNQGCRCDACRVARRDKQRAWKAAAKDRAPKVHGVSGYSNWGCRCEVCTAAWRTEMRERLSRPGAPRDGAEHGRWMYAKYGCRCDVCKAAMAAKRDDYPTTEYQAALQAESVAGAANHGKQWTGPELEVLARDDLTVQQKALLLKRTNAAVRNMLAKLRDDPRKQRLAGRPEPTDAGTRDRGGRNCNHVPKQYITLITGQTIGWFCERCGHRLLYSDWLNNGHV